MIKKLLLIAFIFFLNQCGYEKIYSQKNINFSIKEILIYDDIKIGRQIEKRLKFFSNDTSKKNFYQIFITSNRKKNISSKDKKGNAKTFGLTVSVLLVVDNNLGQKKEIVFTKSTIINNNDNKFELKKHENAKIINLTDLIIDDIIIYLQNFYNLNKKSASLNGNLGLNLKTNDN